MTTANTDMNAARRAKKDEFYTQWTDIEREVLAYVDFNPDTFRGKTILLPCDDPEWSNFTKFFALKFDDLGLKRLISTSYNPGGQGKVYTLDHDATGDGRANMDDIRWEWLEGDGDFRSPEVAALLEQADMVITNPPFSLFRQFLAWIVDANKQFLILGNMISITAKEVWPFIKENKVWYGPSISSGDRAFRVPDSYPLEAAGCGVDEDGHKFIRVKGVRWFTNLDHGRRHEPLLLMSMSDNLRFNKTFDGLTEYVKYDNYDVIEVPKTLTIPSDYLGVMGVPTSFLDKYNPEQFEIVGITESGDDVPVAPLRIRGHEKYDRPYINGKRKFARIFIKHRNPA